MKRREELIKIYMNGYNTFNMKKMLSPLHSKITFENHVKGELKMKLEGIKAFKKQALKGYDMFSKRKQEILSIEHKEDHSVAVINYSATVKADFGDQMKKGEVMNMTAKSMYSFQDDRISRIEDHS